MRFILLFISFIAAAFISNAQSGLQQGNKFNPDRDKENLIRNIQNTNDQIECNSVKDNTQTTPRAFEALPSVVLKNINAYPLFVDASLQSKVQSMLYNQQLQYTSDRILKAAQQQKPARN